MQKTQKRMKKTEKNDSKILEVKVDEQTKESITISYELDGQTISKYHSTEKLPESSRSFRGKGASKRMFELLKDLPGVKGHDTPSSNSPELTDELIKMRNKFLTYGEC